MMQAFFCRIQIGHLLSSILGSEGPKSSDQDIGHQCCIQSHKDSLPQLSPNWLSEGERTKCIESAEWNEKLLRNFNKILFKDGSTRHIYVYHDDPQTVVNWYHAIRCCKLHLLQVLFMTVMQIHPKLQESCYDSPTSYKNPSMNLVTFGKREHNYSSPNYNSCLMITWFRLLIPPSQSLNSLSI